MINICVQDYMTKDKIEIDPFIQLLRENSKLSDEDEAKFAEVERIYQEIGLAKNQRMCPKCEEVMTSTHKYDFVQCKCDYLGIDEVLDYTEVQVFW
ncbi:DUF7695 domain-containing protein [Myroides odoratimimus]|uniref:DUF7695 domain-containing protein n=1 Tax=Myroides odoratimimus TaxID=76832 RepID=UPI0025769B15|nr:hypothetical protein [Myroides odoratimimus]MDM1395703.1 hypothetical protein [Myroides odoratimimus]